MSEIKKAYMLMGLQFKLIEFLTSEIRQACLSEQVNLRTLKVLVRNAATSADTLENLSKAILRYTEEEGKNECICGKRI